MAGYHGYSKSNNAVQAERDHKYPKSRWTKAMIMYELSLQMETDSIKYISLSKKPLAYISSTSVLRLTNGIILAHTILLLIIMKLWICLIGALRI